MARRIHRHAELAAEDGCFAWLVKGTVVGRRPDHEPLLTDIEPLARLDRKVLDEAALVYRERFDLGRESTS